MAFSAFISATNAVIVILLGLVVPYLWSMLNWVWLRPKRQERFLLRQGIRGNPYRLFHGDLKDIKSMGAQALSNPMEVFSHDITPRIRPFLHHTINQYGKNCLMWNGPIPVVSIGEVELARQVLSDYNAFQKPTVNPIADLLARGLVSYEGHKWAEHRNLLTPAFHMEKLKLMLPAFYTSCYEIVSVWEQKISNSEQEFDVRDDLTTLTSDMISRAAFGSSYKDGRRIFKLIKKQLVVFDEISQSVNFPGLRFLPTEKNKKMIGIDREIKTLVRTIIEKRKGGEEIKDDLLGLLMEANSQSEITNKKQKVRITTAEMLDECKLFYFAGQETTSSLLMWTMILLCKHQDWQSRAREEVLNTFGHKKPDFKGLNHLKTINIIFHEVMRLYPPSAEIKRMVFKDNTKLGNLTLPSGTLINLPIHYIHQDTEIWGDDAKEFNPERFANGILKASKGGVAFLGFSWGPRICLGLNFAMIEAKMTMSMILQRFKFELSPSYVHAPCPTSNGLQSRSYHFKGPGRNEKLSALNVLKTSLI